LHHHVQSVISLNLHKGHGRGSIAIHVVLWQEENIIES